MLNNLQKNLLEELEVNGEIDKIVDMSLRKLYQHGGNTNVLDALGKRDLTMWQDCKSEVTIALVEVANLNGLVMSSDLHNIKPIFIETLVDKKGREYDLYTIYGYTGNNQEISIREVKSYSLEWLPDKVLDIVNYYQNNDVLCFTSQTYYKQVWSSVQKYFYKNKQKEYKRIAFSIDDENYKPDIELSDYIAYWGEDAVQNLIDSDIIIGFENYIMSCKDIRRGVKKKLKVVFRYMIFGYNPEEISRLTSFSANAIRYSYFKEIKRLIKEFLVNS